MTLIVPVFDLVNRLEHEGALPDSETELVIDGCAQQCAVNGSVASAGLQAYTYGSLSPLGRDLCEKLTAIRRHNGWPLPSASSFHVEVHPAVVLWDQKMPRPGRGWDVATVLGQTPFEQRGCFDGMSLPRGQNDAKVVEQVGAILRTTLDTLRQQGDGVGKFAPGSQGVRQLPRRCQPPGRSSKRSVISVENETGIHVVLILSERIEERTRKKHRVAVHGEAIENGPIVTGSRNRSAFGRQTVPQRYPG